MTESHLIPVDPADPHINQRGNQYREKLRQGEALLVKPIVTSLMNAGIVTDGDPIVGQAEVYADHELLRSLFFAQMIARARGHNIEVAGK